jgi:hypothetical protein
VILTAQQSCNRTQLPLPRRMQLRLQKLAMKRVKLCARLKPQRRLN